MGPLRSSSRVSSDSTKSVDKSVDKQNVRLKKSGKLIEEEMAETGSVKLDVYKKYMQTIGWILSAVILLCFVVSNLSQVFGSLWLSEWANDALDPNNVGNTALRDLRLGVYAGLGTAEAILSFAGSAGLILGCIKASRIIHNNMLQRIIRAPMSFFG